MCREGALAMYSNSNCVFYLCTGVVVTVSYSCVLEILYIYLFYDTVSKLSCCFSSSQYTFMYRNQDVAGRRRDGGQYRMEDATYQESGCGWR